MKELTEICKISLIELLTYLANRIIFFFLVLKFNLKKSKQTIV